MVSQQPDSEQTFNFAEHTKFARPGIQTEPLASHSSIRPDGLEQFGRFRQYWGIGLCPAVRQEWLI